MPVEYGPWSEGAEYAESWTWMPDSVDPNYWTREHTISPDPGVTWEEAGGLKMDRDATRSGFGNDTSDSFEGDYGLLTVSENAWDEMLASPDVADAELHAPTIHYHGDFGYPILPVGFGHEEEWTGYAAERGGTFIVRTSGLDWPTLAGAGATPPGASGIDFEDSGSSTLSSALSLDIGFALGGDVRWHLCAIGVQDGPSYEEGSTGFRLDTNDGTGLFVSPAAPDLGNSGSASLDVDALNAWKADYATSGGLSFVHPSRGPKFAVTWTGGFPGNSKGPDRDYDLPGATVTVTYRWKVSRWRWRYPDGIPTVPYRRIFPRDDGLGGGAPRNYPPSKAVQSGNRTTGGYL